MDADPSAMRTPVPVDLILSLNDIAGPPITDWKTL
jgi:hypothetical protein